MIKPNEIPVWSTDTNYPAGAEAFSSTPTKVVAVSGLIATGWTPKLHPPAQNMNYWMNLVGRWIAWNTRTPVKTYSAYSIAPGSNWAHNVGGRIDSSGVGKAYLDLNLNVGDRPRDININRWGNASDDLTIEVAKTLSTGAESILATLVVVDPAAAWTNTRINFAADTGVMSIDAFVVDAFQRASGSFITDGFVPGMTVQPSGYTNAGNNTTRVLSVVNALTMQVTDTTGMIGEAGTGDEQLVVVPPTVAAAESLYIVFTSTGAGGGRVGATTLSYDDGSVVA